MLAEGKHKRNEAQPGSQHAFCAPQTLERSYLLRVNGVVVERPQHMLMRVSVGIHKEVRCLRSCKRARRGSKQLTSPAQSLQG